jgi:hypothetical protein
MATNPFDSLIARTATPRAPLVPSASLQSRVQAAPETTVVGAAPEDSGIMAYLKNPWVIGIGVLFVIVIAYLLYRHLSVSVV